MKKLFFYLFIFISIFLIYKLTFKYGINYVALGDSLSNGKSPYGNNNYGFTNYISDYLEEFNILNNFNSTFISNEYRINDIYNAIKFNDKNIKRLLRESDLVTITIGINDLFYDVNTDNMDVVLKNNRELNIKLNEIIYNYNNLLKEIRKYAKKDIIIIGYYNPFPYITNYKKEIDRLMIDFNNKCRNIAIENNIHYIDIFDIFDNNYKYLPNPFDMHPNNYGYKAIFDKIKTQLDSKIIKIH